MKRKSISAIKVGLSAEGSEKAEEFLMKAFSEKEKEILSGTVLDRLIAVLEDIKL